MCLHPGGVNARVKQGLALLVVVRASLLMISLVGDVSVQGIVVFAPLNVAIQDKRMTRLAATSLAARTILKRRDVSNWVTPVSNDVLKF